MIVGVPREIKSDEYRVAMLPVGAEELTGAGHTVLIESGAGQGSDITATFVDAANDTLPATASYRSSSGYIDPPAGIYTLTLATGSFVLYTGTVTLAKGDVRTFIVQSTVYAATPGPGNTKVTNLLDNQW